MNHASWFVVYNLYKYHFSRQTMTSKKKKNPTTVVFSQLHDHLFFSEYYNIMRL